MDSTDPANDGLPGRASEWLMALADRPDDAALRAGLQRWLAASAENRLDWEQMNQAWQGLGEIGPLVGPASSDPETSVPPRGDAAGRRHASVASRHVSMGSLAALMLVVSVALAWRADVLVRWQADHFTGTAERQQFVLDDGSRVDLAPRSALDVAFSGRERRVRLLQGQAFFVVAAGDRRPFVVEAGDVEARDIGTEFDVLAGGAGTEVAVREGIVEVTAAGLARAAELRAGDWMRIAGAGAVAHGRRDADQIGAWQRGRLMVQAQPVGAVVDALRPYYAGTIVLIGDRLARQPLTGAYNLADPVGALRAVAAAQGADVYRVSPWLVVVSGE